MQTQDLMQLLTTTPYPGRGITLGLCETGQWAVVAYFIMGRSANSRNRVFTEKDGGIITEAADPAKLEDPSLIIYAPVRLLGNRTIVTNGDQTDTVYDALAKEETFEAALRRRTFEPDAPNYTPRISGLLTADYGGFGYQLSILKSNNNDARSVQRFFYDYPQPMAGQGHFISTYAGVDAQGAGSGAPLPSFQGEPVSVTIKGELDDFANNLWNSLNEDNKVSLFVRALRLDGTTETRVFNKYSKI